MFVGFVDPRPRRREENRTFEAKTSRRSKKLSLHNYVTVNIYPIYIKSYTYKGYIYKNYTHSFDKKMKSA